MNADSLIRTFYSALSRDLLIYMITVAIAALVAWGIWWWGWYSRRIKNRRGWLAAALVLTIIGGGLFAAAYSYRVGIPAKLDADLTAAQTNLDTARQAIIDRYRAERGVPHFRRLAIIWTVVGGTAIATSPLCQYE
jgi:MFS family permease